MKKVISIALTTIIIALPITVSANFKDLPLGAPHFDAIMNLSNSGCLKGYSDNTVHPDDKITRVETLKLLLTCLEIPKIY